MRVRLDLTGGRVDGLEGRGRGVRLLLRVVEHAHLEDALVEGAAGLRVRVVADDRPLDVLDEDGRNLVHLDAVAILGDGHDAVARMPEVRAVLDIALVGVGERLVVLPDHDVARSLAVREDNERVELVVGVRPDGLYGRPVRVDEAELEKLRVGLGPGLHLGDERPGAVVGDGELPGDVTVVLVRRGGIAGDGKVRQEVEGAPADKATPVRAGRVVKELVDGLEDRGLVRVAEVELVPGPVRKAGVAVEQELAAVASLSQIVAGVGLPQLEADLVEAEGRVLEHLRGDTADLVGVRRVEDGGRLELARGVGPDRHPLGDEGGIVPVAVLAPLDNALRSALGHRARPGARAGPAGSGERDVEPDAGPGLELDRADHGLHVHVENAADPEKRTGEVRLLRALARAPGDEALRGRRTEVRVSRHR